MNRKRFLRLLAIHGADPARWPDRAGMEALLSKDAELRAAFDEQARLDRALGHFTEQPAAPELARRIIAATAGVSQEPPAPDPLHSLWPALACLAASALIGFFVGTTHVAPGRTVDLSGLMFGLDTTDL